MLSHIFAFLLSSCSISHCGSWTFWSGSSRAWCSTSCTRCCAPSAGITRSRWASFSSATTTCCSSCCGTASCWAKPTRTPWTATAWASSPSDVFREGFYQKTVNSSWYFFWYGSIFLQRFYLFKKIFYFVYCYIEWTQGITFAWRDVSFFPYVKVFQKTNKQKKKLQTVAADEEKLFSTWLTWHPDFAKDALKKKKIPQAASQERWSERKFNLIYECCIISLHCIIVFYDDLLIAQCFLFFCFFLPRRHFFPVATQHFEA